MDDDWLQDLRFRPLSEVPIGFGMVGGAVWQTNGVEYVSVKLKMRTGK